MKSSSRRRKPEETKYMKQIIPFNVMRVIAILALTVGCATTTSTENTESMLVASGFKVVTPKTGEQRANLQKLPRGNVDQINKGGKTYYVFPDAAHNQAYVGGPKQYQAYQKYRLEHK